MIKVYIVYIHSINNLNIVIFIYMSYTIKYVRLYESSPFKKIRIKDEDEDDKLKRIIKRHDIMKDSIFLKDIDNCLFKILAAFYKHIRIMNDCANWAISREAMPKFFYINNNDCSVNLICNLALLSYPYNFTYDSIEDFLKNKTKIKIDGSKLVIRLPYTFAFFGKKYINIINPHVKNNITLKDLYVNELVNILLYGHTNKELVSYYNSIADLGFDMSIFTEFNDVITQYNINAIDIKYYHLENDNNHYHLENDNDKFYNAVINLIDIQNLEEAVESFFSVFENNRMPVENINRVVLINSFMKSVDYNELQDILSLFCVKNKLLVLYSYIMSDRKDVNKFMSMNNFLHITSDLCTNIRFYDHANLSNLSIVDNLINDVFILRTYNPKKCSIKNSIFDSIYRLYKDTINNSLKAREIQYDESPTRFDVLASTYKMNDYKSHEDFIKKLNNLKYNEKLKMNTNNDEYSKYLSKIFLRKTYSQKYVGAECISECIL